MAQPFDMDNLQLTTETFTISENVQGFSVSSTGTLTYRVFGSSLSQFVWVDRKGTELAAIAMPGYYYPGELSPDGKKILARRWSPTIEGANLWLLEWMRGIVMRFTFDRDEDSSPVWSSDGRTVAFKRSNRIYQKSTAEANDHLLLDAAPEWVGPISWSRDSRFLIYESYQPGPSALSGSPLRDLWILPMFGDRKPIPFARTRADEARGRFSPDGRLIAYDSDESSRYQVYVQPFPSSNAKWQVSTDGGYYPRWNRSGNEIFYISKEGILMSVRVDFDGRNFEAKTPEPLFQLRLDSIYLSGTGYGTPYDVSPDAQRFLILRPELQNNSAVPITVVVNFAAGLKK